MAGARYSAIVGCGLGPLRLQALRGSARLFPLEPANRHTALAAKLLAANGHADRVILSGWASNWRTPGPDATAHELREHTTAEGELLAEIYERVRGRAITRAGHERATAWMLVDRSARTTGGNLIAALNLLDRKRGGYWRGTLGLLSSTAHLVRIAELLRAFGIEDAAPIGAQAVLRAFGYRAERLYPRMVVQGDEIDLEPEPNSYADELRGFRNLRQNPAYLTYDLAKIVSDRRLHAVAWSLRRYYAARGIALPALYLTLPADYDPAWSYDQLRRACAATPPVKLTYVASSADIEQYRARAQALDRYPLP